MPKKDREIYVVWGENCFSENGEVAWLVGAYSTKEKAERAKAEAEQETRDERPDIKLFVDLDEESNEDWDRDYTIEKLTVDQ